MDATAQCTIVNNATR